MKRNQYITTDEAAKRLGRTEVALFSLMQRGAVRHIRTGNDTMVYASDIAAILDQQQRTGNAFP